MSALPFLPYGRQTVDEADVAAVVEVLRGDWLTQGPAVADFEERLKERTGAAHAIACATGTAALHIAYAALDLIPGDAVVVPAITFLATASTARMAGGEVAFADVDPATGLLTIETAKAAIARAEAQGWRVRAVVPVHYAGQTADLPALAALAEAHGAVLIEDACHAVGSVDERDGRCFPVGGCDWSRMTVFSFHPVKTVAAGEGGAVATNDPVLAKRLFRLRNHGMTRDPAEFEDTAAAFASDGSPNPWYYELPEPAPNYRLTDIQSALAASQMRRLDALVARRQYLLDRYTDRLAPLAPLVQPLARVPWCRPGWHLCTVRIDFTAAGHERAAVMAALRARGIGTQVLYIPVHRQPFWRRRYGRLELTGADAFYDMALSLPLFPAMADGDVDRVTGALAEVLAGRLP